MKTKNFEFYLARLYIHESGFWFTLFEIQNFTFATGWALLQFGKSKTGYEITFGGKV